MFDRALPNNPTGSGRATRGQWNASLFAEPTDIMGKQQQVGASPQSDQGCLVNGSSKHEVANSPSGASLGTSLTTSREPDQARQQCLTAVDAGRKARASVSAGEVPTMRRTARGF
jgi:hypothetical protein